MDLLEVRFSVLIKVCQSGLPPVCRIKIAGVRIQAGFKQHYRRLMTSLTSAPIGRYVGSELRAISPAHNADSLPKFPTRTAALGRVQNGPGLLRPA
jgi:hypothetical protein